MTRYIITCVNRIVAEPGDFLLVEDNNVVEAFKNPYADLHVEPAANVVPATPKPAVAAVASVARGSDAHPFRR